MGLVLDSKDSGRRCNAGRDNSNGVVIIAICPGGLSRRWAFSAMAKERAVSETGKDR